MDSRELEQHVLSCVLKDGNCFYEIQDWLSHQSFQLMNADLWRAFEEISSNDLYIDKVTVANQLEKWGKLDSYIPFLGSENIGRDGIDYLFKLDSNPDKVLDYAKALSEIKNLRDITSLKDKVSIMIDTGKPSAEILSYMDSEGGKISGNSLTILSSLVGIREVIKQSKEVVGNALDGISRYIESGLSAIDDFIGGFHPGRLYIIAAMSGEGKSALLTDIAYNLAIDEEYLKTKGRRRIKIGFINLEMTPLSVFHRLIQRITGIDSIRLEKGKFNEGEPALYQKAIEDLEEITDDVIVFENASEINISQVRQKIRKMVADGCELIIVDQLQQVQPPNNMLSLSRHTLYDFISYRLLAFAREFDVPIVLAHQLNRSADSYQNKNVELNLTSLNEGGERAANSVMFIRHKKESGEIKESYFWHVKNREGRTGRKQVKFTGKYLLFEDIEDDVPEYMVIDENVPLTEQ